MSYWFPKLQTTTASSPTTEPSTTQRNYDEGTVDFNDFITEQSELISSENDDDDNDESSNNNIDKFNAIFKR